MTLEDCDELARQEGDQNRWMTAARYASSMLPGIFRKDDPALNLEFAPEGRLALEGALASIPKPVFTADDSVGWMYQFWQSKKKKDVSSSGNKIEGLDLAAYSQLFTEDYMVRFLLENSLGAWWASRHPDSPIVERFQYLRYQEDGTPASGTFPEWPDTAAEITLMDPCCGSGHFLVTAFDMLRRMRMEEEGIAGRDAGDAVIRENLFGLEIDPRCVQIAAFALALAAWKAGGYRELPPMNIACSGIPVRGQLEAWKKLAKGDGNMERILERLHGMFVNAPDLGSLISPSNVPVEERMFAPDFEAVAPLLENALEKEKDTDPVAAVFGNTTRGVARAAELLYRQYTLVITNVPFLTRGKQGDTLKCFIEREHSDAKADLSTAFVQRCQAFTAPGGSQALVTPQNWLFLVTYRDLRRHLLTSLEWNLVALLGMAAFSDMNWWAFNTALTVITGKIPAEGHAVSGVDASEKKGPAEKSGSLKSSTVVSREQGLQLSSPDARISLAINTNEKLLSDYAHSFQGIATADYPRYGRCFWELPTTSEDWVYQQSTVKANAAYGGREHILFWENGSGSLAKSKQARIQGLGALQKQGVAVSQMNRLPSTLYCGDHFDNNTAIAVPKNPEHLPAIWRYCSSEDFFANVRSIDSAIKVTNGTLLKVPFDLEHWQRVADEEWPAGLPEPYSDDPTQWLFEGNPADSTSPLQVAVARLMGYQWPQQKEDELSASATPEGMICLVPVTGQEPATERLRSVLAATYDDWSVEQQAELLRQVGFEGKTLADWLRDGFFEQHCKLFHHRPFIWHVWDGRKNGFSALVNYHKLNAANLNRLIYTYLGNWISTQKAAEESGTPGASAKLVAAMKLQKELEAIRDGVPPYDIYVRWKPLHEQPIGWNPDLNDGVRINIRPFATAGILRSKVKVNWNKDRGKNVDGSERENNLHFGTAEKLAAREAIEA